MLSILLEILESCWNILAEASPYILFGFLAAGILKALIPDSLVARHLGGNSKTSVIKASLFGIPLPLCSCGVIPAAIGLRRQGAGRGASAAFLVSTPESGVDSIAITYALLDPVMTVLRPLAAFVTATVTGLLINLLPEEPAVALETELSALPTEDSAVEKTNIWQRIRDGIAYAFGGLLKDIGGWLLVGVAVAGLIGYLVPDDLFTFLQGHNFLSMLAMLLIGIPLYICASASTPIAAALILKGISPGAALVFLLAGPATNAATLTLVGRFWGRAATTVYLLSIAVCSLALGGLTDLLYDFAGWDIVGQIQAVVEHGPSLIDTLAAILLLGLWGKNFLPNRHGPDDDCSCDIEKDT
jgi:hypothetical protein